MAILGRFNISVCVDGQPLPEHDGPSPANVIDDEAFHSCHKFVQVPDSDKDYYMRFEQAVPREIPAGEVVLLRVVVDGKKRQGLTVTDTAQMDLPVLGTFARVETSIAPPPSPVSSTHAVCISDKGPKPRTQTRPRSSGTEPPPRRSVSSRFGFGEPSAMRSPRPSCGIRAPRWSRILAGTRTVASPSPRRR